VTLRKKKTRRVVGDIVAVPMGDGRFGLAWVLAEPLMAFLEYVAQSADAVAAVEPWGKPVAFRVWVMNRAVTDGLWPVVAHNEVPAQLATPPLFFKQDPLSGALSTTRGGFEEWPASPDEVRGLERAAVWTPKQVVERLEDHFAGRPNKWVETLRFKK
jgi:hypothetical protein